MCLMRQYLMKMEDWLRRSNIFMVFFFYLSSLLSDALKLFFAYIEARSCRNYGCEMLTKSGHTFFVKFQKAVWQSNPTKMNIQKILNAPNCYKTTDF